MGTVPTGKLERELRREYSRFVDDLARTRDHHGAVKRFRKSSLQLMNTMGADVASLGSLAGFPSPKELDMDPVAGYIYDDMLVAAIQVGVSIGQSPRKMAAVAYNAGLMKDFHKIERTARTETVRAYWKNQWDSADGLGLVMVWSSETSSRTCDYCLSRDGMVVRNSSIRDHPNGRCTLAPMLPSQVKYKGTLQADGTVVQEPERVWNPEYEPAPTPVATPLATSEDRYLGYTNLAGEYNPDPIYRFTDSAFPSINSFSSSQIESVKEYTGSAYEPINEALRSKHSVGELQSIVDNLDSMIDSSVTKDNMVVHRKVSLDAFGDIDLDQSAGTTFQDRGFMSTSLSDDVYVVEEEHVSLAIRVPQGSKAAYVDPVSEFQGE